MKQYSFTAFLLILLAISALNGGSVNALHYFYLVHQVFPEVTDLYIMIDKDRLASEMSKIQSGSAQYSIKTSVYDAENQVDIGKAIRDMKENSYVVIYDDQIFLEKKNMMYILSKCTERQISIITSSREYIEAGALLGYIDDGGSKKIVLNLKHYEHLKEKFTVEFIQKVGIHEVIS